MKILAHLNNHPRDKNIVFFEEGHIYKIENIPENPISVTTLIHKQFPVFDAEKVVDKMVVSGSFSSKYPGKTREEIIQKWKQDGEESSSLGTKMHADIERYLNNETPLDCNSVEFGYFLNFWKDFNTTNPKYVPYRTEWLVYDEDKNIAGSIDFVLTNNEGQYIILDWKRSKEIKKENRYEKGYGVMKSLDNCNFWHYTLQLNIYRHILETKYDKKIVFMMLVVLHPNNQNYVLHVVEHYDIKSIWDSLFTKKDE